MQRLRKQIIGISTTNRSRVTNGMRLLTGIDGRSPTARRFRDIMYGYLQEFDVRTERERVLVRQAATLAVVSERLQAQLVNGEPIDADTIVKLTGQLHRVLRDLKCRTEQRGPAPPSIHEHVLASHGAFDDADEGGDD